MIVVRIGTIAVRTGNIGTPMWEGKFRFNYSLNRIEIKTALLGSPGGNLIITIYTKEVLI